MSEPALSFIIPTIDPKRPLRRCLLSLEKQPLGPRDEVIVVIDGSEGLKPEIEATVRSFGPRYRVLYLDTGHACWGHCQIWWGARYEARGDYINYNDDDDIWTKGSVARIRDEIKRLPEPTPLMFKYQPYGRVGALWDEQSLDGVGLSAHMVVFPNMKDKIPKYQCRVFSDRQWAIDICNAWGRVRWVDSVIQIGRPSPKDWPERWGE
jgi:glycosyltransferase involved in cell wall biosynthesis